MAWWKHKDEPGASPGRHIVQPDQRPPPPAHMQRRWEGLPDDEMIAAHPDPDVLLQDIFRRQFPGRLPVGIPMTGTGWSYVTRDQHLLVIGPAQSHAGKTASIIIPHVLSWPGPVVVATTKPDVLPATAIARAQVGNLWMYAPDGDTSHLPPGVRELRWSPVTGSANWDVAYVTARSMVEAVKAEDVRYGSHWQERAAALLGPVLHWAATTGRGMEAVVDAVNRHRERLPAIRDELGREPRAQSMLVSVLDAAGEEKASIASNAGKALQMYGLTGAMRSTQNPNFDPADFVNGGLGFRADTVYITGVSRDQRNVAPLITGFLDQIQGAAYRRHRNLLARGLIGAQGSEPILFVLDELHNLAPLPNLPHILSEGGGQGVKVVGAVQDFTLLKARWPDEADSFKTTFGHRLFFPRLGDDATLRYLSDLLGKEQVVMRSETHKREQASSTAWLDRLAGLDPEPERWEEKLESVQYSPEWRPRYDIDHVLAGPVPEDPDYVFHFSPYTTEIVRMTPYWRAAPWPHVLTAYLERALSGCVPQWRSCEAVLSHEEPDLEDALPALPVPRLHPWAEWAVGHSPNAWDREWGSRFFRAVEERDAILRRGPRQARWDIHKPVMAFDSYPFYLVTHGEARLPTSPPSSAGERDTPPVPPEAERKAIGTTADQPAGPDPAARPVRHFPCEEAWTPEDEAAMLRRRTDDDPEPPAFRAVLEGLELAVLEEKTRRRSLGDHVSVDRFDAEFRRTQEKLSDPAFMQQCLAERDAAYARGEDWGWWKFGPPPPVMRLIQAFLLREDIGESREEGGAAAAPTDDDGPVIAASPVPDPGLQAPGPDDDPPGDAPEPEPEPGPPPASPDIPPPEGWHPHWGPGETETMREWARTSSEPGATPGFPECFTAAVRAMHDATERECARRRGLGDYASVERYNRDRALIYGNNDLPEARAAWDEEYRTGVVRGENMDFWIWLPPGLAAINRKFLRGEGLEIPAREIPRDDRSAGPPGPPVLPGAPEPTAAVPKEVPPPPECWEPDWRPEDTAAMLAWAGRGPPPDCYTRTIAAMNAAAERESERRRELGDEASVDHYTRERRRVTEELAGGGVEAPPGAMASDEEGFWRWVPSGIAALTRPFLRGEAPAAPAASPPPATDPPPGISPERWRQIQEQTARERADRMSRWRQSPST